MRGSRATTASPNRLTQAGTSRFAGALSRTGRVVVARAVIAGEARRETGNESVSSSARLPLAVRCHLAMDDGTSVDGLEGIAAAGPRRRAGAGRAPATGGRSTSVAPRCRAR